MDWQEILGRQLLDPFRWGLILALVATMLRTEAATGRWLPLSAGVALVAAIIPLAAGGPAGTPLALAVALGVVANLVVLLVVLAARGAWLRARR